MKTTLLITLIAVCGSSLAAQDRRLRELFEQFDRNDDGSVSRAEFPGSPEQFAAMDRNRDGSVSLAEYARSAIARRILAARREDALEPRERGDAVELRLARLAEITRFDRNGDGRVRAAEWTGSPTAFVQLDLNRDGVLDAADRRLAQRDLDLDRIGTYDDLAPFTVYLPSIDDIFKRRDKNRDQLISRNEAVHARFAECFRLADTNLDDFLDRDEVTAMAREIAVRVRQRNRPNVKPRAYVVPFSSWDKNNDGRIDTGEWLSRQYLFPRIDLDRDGAVTREEVRRYKISVEGDGFIGKFDLDGNGIVSEREFGGPAAVFRRADRNGDGAVTAADR